MSYHWPGNVRELENVIERSVLVCEGQVLHAHHLPPTLQTAETSETTLAQPLQEAVGAYERDLITDALKSARGNRARAARLLQTTERILNYKVRKYASTTGASAADRGRRRPGSRCRRLAGRLCRRQQAPRHRSGDAQQYAAAQHHGEVARRADRPGVFGSSSFNQPVAPASSQPIGVMTSHHDVPATALVCSRRRCSAAARTPPAAT